MCACGQESTTTHYCPVLAGPLCLCGTPANQSHSCRPRVALYAVPFAPVSNPPVLVDVVELALPPWWMRAA